MIKTVPHGTVSPQMMYKKYKRLVYTSADLVLKYRVELLTTVHCKPLLYKVQEDNYNLYFP